MLFASRGTLPIFALHSGWMIQRRTWPSRSVKCQTSKEGVPSPMWGSGEYFTCRSVHFGALLCSYIMQCNRERCNTAKYPNISESARLN